MLSMGPREHVLCVGTSVEPVSAPRFSQKFDLTGKPAAAAQTPVGCSDFGLTLTPGHDLGLYRHLRIMARSTTLCACTGEHIGSFGNDPSVVTSTVYGICTILQIAAFAASHSGLPSRAIANNAAGVRHRQPRARPSTKIIPGCPPRMSTARRKWRFAHDSSNQRV